ncbi:hypothetical protein Ade02nite_19830 [Paractinoplanes deccanensis]|uniref:Uncharacterized protein n=1 Tax=Paractinoplanes deccanensis TaxID=113561 RepID=A0ABQ3Y064_9ACTN|nr:hypothetical protein Ade02nite_19830 [Actinoplanes deccanensis]
MPTTNPIRRGHLDKDWGWSYGGGKVHPIREWYAVCPDCGDVVRCTGQRGTRKAAKDALYRHRQKQHAPGSVGR